MQRSWLVLRGRSPVAGPFDTRGEAITWVQSFGEADVKWRVQLRVRPAQPHHKEPRGREEEEHATS